LSVAFFLNFLFILFYLLFYHSMILMHAHSTRL